MVAADAGHAAEPDEGKEADVKPQAVPAPHVGLYRSIWVSLLLTCNPAIQARVPARPGEWMPPPLTHASRVHLTVHGL